MIKYKHEGYVVRTLAPPPLQQRFPKRITHSQLLNSRRFKFSEPIPAERVLTPRDTSMLFLRSQLQSANASLGKSVELRLPRTMCCC